MRFSIRDLLWLTVVMAVALGLGLGWWRDRQQLAIPAADYRRLKAEDEAVTQFMKAIQLPEIPEEVEDEIRRPVPGDDDYQLPLTYPLHYGPSDSPRKPQAAARNYP